MNILTNIRRRFMVTCEDVNTFLVAYLEGELDERTHRRFKDHIADCECCHALLEQYQDIIELAAEDADPGDADVPEELAERTVAFLREHTKDDHL